MNMITRGTHRRRSYLRSDVGLMFDRLTAT